MVLEYRERILQMAELQPLLPVQVAKEFETNTLLASAMLSEMSSKGLLKVSALKIGSSPLYYRPEKQEQLLNYLQYLNEKDRKTVDLLKEKQILRESDVDPFTRVSLKQIKDFARPLEVSIDDKTEVFWKWSLLSDKDAEQLIRQVIEPEKTPVQQTVETPQEKPKRQRRVQKPSMAPDDFLNYTHKFFSTNKIQVIEQIAIKKKTEYDFIIKLDSTVGALTYYCKARNKKSVSESDVSLAFVQGQLRKLPVLLLTTGDLTKQATLLAQELKGLTVKKI